MKLKDIFPNASFNCDISGLTQNCDEVKPQYIFFAVKGHTVDGHNFIPLAIERGASVIVSEQKLKIKQAIKVDNIDTAMATASLKFYKNPSKDLKMIGITGTKGKTSIAYLLESIFAVSNIPVAVLGTINYRINGTVLSKAPNTTPVSLTLQHILSEARQEKANTVIMEVSSHALELKRVDGISFDTAIFTNLQRDHLDFHHTFENYFQAKYKLFENLISSNNEKPHKTAVINIDDDYGIRLAKLLEGKVKVLTYSQTKPASFYATDIKTSLEGVIFKINGFPARINLLGAHNVYNALAAVAAASSQGIPLETCLKGIESLEGVPGRMQAIKEGQPFNVFVDFAYTQEALLRAFETVAPFKNGRIITVFGCGGERDTTKRPLMGKSAVEKSAYVFITNDNPRRENPDNIISDILKGVGEHKNFEVIKDRRQAIYKAIQTARKNDIVIIAGKGHEDYQLLPTGKIHFSDEEEARRALKEYV